MGHTWRELCPEQASAHDNYWGRVNKLRGRLGKAPSGAFTVRELITAMRVMGAFHGDTNPTTSELEEVEAFLDERDKKKGRRKGKRSSPKRA